MAVDELIDLRDPVDPSSPEAAPEEPETSDHGRPLRKLVLLCVLAFVGLLVVDKVLGSAVHSQHQTHLASEFGDPLAEFEPGDAYAVLQIPSLGFNQVVAEGASIAELRGGPGRRLDSTDLTDPDQAEAENGNTVIMGTSTRFGGPFEKLADIEAGKSIYLQTRAGMVHKFKVTSVDRAGDGDIDALAVDGPRRLTLVTSAAGPLSGDRVVVTALPDVGSEELEESSADAEVSESDVSVGVGSAAAAIEEGEVPQTFDVRSLGDWVLLICGIGLIAVGIIAWGGLRGRYRFGTVAIVAGSSLSLGVVLLLFNIAVIVPSTY
jgi:sortase (surface protein transpeptidase)